MVPSAADDPGAGRLWRDLERLAEFREEDQPGWTRRVFSAAHHQGREWLRERMGEAGLEVHQDPVGNLLGELPGRSGGGVIVIGSHSDTVAGGGRFDGPLGVLAAIAVAEGLAERGGLEHPLRVADFLGEEPNRFGLSCLGSRAVAGNLSPAHLELSAGEDGTLGQTLGELVGRAPDLDALPWERGSIHACFELHIEQGTRLERAGRPLGVVTTIAGISRARVRVLGRLDHAGTAAMDERRDALALAAELVLLVERLAGDRVAGASGVGTVGWLEVLPGAANVVPGEVLFDLELRSASSEWLADRGRALESGLERASALRRCQVELQWQSRESPVECAPSCRSLISRAIESLGEQPIEVDSMASHDSAQLARLAPTGMIFVPSRQGRSHCPEEWTEPAQVALGLAALQRTVELADREPGL